MVRKLDEEGFFKELLPLVETKVLKDWKHAVLLNDALEIENAIYKMRAISDVFSVIKNEINQSKRKNK